MNISPSYAPNCCKDIENTGASFKVNIDGEGTCEISNFNYQLSFFLHLIGNILFAALKGGPCGDDEFKLWQFHAHWGAEDGRGSEHTVGGKEYPGEV